MIELNDESLLTFRQGIIRGGQPISVSNDSKPSDKKSCQDHSHQQCKTAQFHREANIMKQLDARDHAIKRKLKRMNENYRRICLCRVTQLQEIFTRMRNDEVEYKFQRARVLGYDNEEPAWQTSVLVLFLALSSPCWLFILLIRDLFHRFNNFYSRQ